MNSYKLSRLFFDWSFNNPSKITLEDVYKSKSLPLKDYSNGGFYLIDTEFGLYIGKSIDYMFRLKTHLRKSTNKILIDRVLNNCNSIDVYLLLKYSDVNVNFYTRKLETIIEQTFISIASKHNYNLLNDRIYGHLQIV
jgi:hypothetical protein